MLHLTNTLANWVCFSAVPSESLCVYMCVCVCARVRVGGLCVCVCVCVCRSLTLSKEVCSVVPVCGTPLPALVGLLPLLGRVPVQRLPLLKGTTLRPLHPHAPPPAQHALPHQPRIT